MTKDEESACPTCAWPLDCCPDNQADSRERSLRDCPMEHEVWDRRLGEAREDQWNNADETPLGEATDLPALELVYV